jgi:hypothetical protein
MIPFPMQRPCHATGLQHAESLRHCGEQSLRGCPDLTAEFSRSGFLPPLHAHPDAARTMLFTDGEEHRSPPSKKGGPPAMRASPTRPDLSGKAREVILAQHEQLRRLVAETSAAAGLSAMTNQSFDLLRAKTRALYLRLDEHMRFEESVLEIALRDIIGRGAELHAQVVKDHQRQRAILTKAIAELGRSDLSGEEIVRMVRWFVDILVRDMEAEEQVLLSAEVDALLADGQAG